VVKCSDCKYYSWDWFDDGEEFRSCLYWFFTQTNIYPALENNNPWDEDEDWDCKYFKRDEDT
jgi:hypothetical protein